MDNFKFMDSWPAWVRWLAVLPTIAIALGIVVGITVLLYLLMIAPHDRSPYAILPLAKFADFFACALFIWCGVAAAPRSKLVVASILSLAPILLIYRDYATLAMNSRLLGSPGMDALYSSELRDMVASISGFVVAWGLIVWGDLRRRQAGLPS